VHICEQYKDSDFYIYSNLDSGYAYSDFKTLTNTRALSTEHISYMFDTQVTTEFRIRVEPVKDLTALTTYVYETNSINVSDKSIINTELTRADKYRTRELCNLYTEVTKYVVYLDNVDLYNLVVYRQETEDMRYINDAYYTTTYVNKVSRKNIPREDFKTLSTIFKYNSYLVNHSYANTTTFSSYTEQSDIDDTSIIKIHTTYFEPRASNYSYYHTTYTQHRVYERINTNYKFHINVNSQYQADYSKNISDNNLNTVLTNATEITQARSNILTVVNARKDNRVLITDDINVYVI
jgi:hypothetical protein